MNSQKQFDYTIKNSDMVAFQAHSRAYKRKRDMIRMIMAFIALASSYGLVAYFMLEIVFKAIKDTSML